MNFRKIIILGTVVMFLLATSAVAVCSTQRCQEVDEAWLRFASSISSQFSNLVWDLEQGWIDFETAYPSREEEVQEIAAANPPSLFQSDLSPPELISDPQWREHQERVQASADAAGPAGGERFNGFSTKTVTVDKPDFNGQSSSNGNSAIWSIDLNPSKTCPNSLCLNDITPKSRGVEKKKGVVIHATVGGDYLGLAKRWSQAYWNPATYMECHHESVDEWNNNYASTCGHFLTRAGLIQYQNRWPYTPADAPGGEDPLSDEVEQQLADCAKSRGMNENNGYRLSINSCRGVNIRTQYVFGRNGNYAQHASELANIWHTMAGSDDNEIPPEHWDVNTIGIEVSNAVDECNSICSTARGTTYKDYTVADGYCNSNSCQSPNQLWSNSNNYRPLSDLNYPRSLMSKFYDNANSLEIYPEEQMKGLVKLVAEIMIRHDIHIDNLIRHYDNTKRGSGSTHWDPGVNFDWMGFKKAVCQAINQYTQGTPNAKDYDCNNLLVCQNCGAVQ